MTRLPPLTTADVIRRLRPEFDLPRLAAPKFDGSNGGLGRPTLFLSVESFRRHTTDEGWQIQLALEQAGARLAGHGLGDGCTHVPTLLRRYRPSTVIIQDPREWDADSSNCFVKEAQFTDVDCLADKENAATFKVSTLKDAHRNGPYYRDFAERIGVHAWIIYYHPAIVAHLAPWARQQHFIRTYHTIDAKDVPPFTSGVRDGCLLSGALSVDTYPLRTRLASLAKRGKLPGVTFMGHPGYGASGTHTPAFLKMLSNYRASICTASIYGYALRKIIESTACGCRVITDLPVNEVLPAIDGNLVRVNPGEPPQVIAEIVAEAVDEWDAETQYRWAMAARRYYDWRAEGERAAEAIEWMKVEYR